MNSSWLDINIDGRRLNRVIRLLETKLNKATDEDTIVRYANSIAFITGKKIEIVDRVLGVKELLKGNPNNNAEKYKVD